VKIAVDANVLIDMFERREPHYLASAHVLSLIAVGNLSAIVPAHTVPNIYYVIRKIRGRQIAEDSVDWMLRSFVAVPPTTEIMRAARDLPMTDFEDAIVAVSAHLTDCDYIVTRDLADFVNSPVPAIAPLRLLTILGV
jgi:predicted nucleic acid-binding protein